MSSNKDKREISRTFGQKLRFFRNLRGYTCKELGLLAKMDAGYINKLEMGHRRAPSYPIIRNLAMALKVDITDLIDIDLSEGDDLPKKSIQEVLVYNEYLINGKLPSLETRENLLALMQTMLDSEWEENNKHTDTVKILNKVDIFLRSLKK
jgi:transcriptional regulator with XRE-family HTH domain